MNKAQSILISIVYIFFIYLASITSYVLERFGDIKDKTKVFDDPLSLFIFPSLHPLKNIINLIQSHSMIFFVLVGLATLFILYVILKMLFGTKDNNLKNQDYKIAKHGSHGSARFSTLKELFSSGYYKPLKIKNVNTLILETLDESLLDDNTNKKGVKQ